MYASAPLLVAFPRDAADVAAAVAAAARFDVPVVTRGAGTSLAGQTAGGQGLVLDTSRHMDAIGEIDVAARRVRVGPGVVQEDLNRAVAPHGLGLRPRHLDLQPGHARRHDRQQLLRQPLDRLRHDDRPRARARGRARRRLDARTLGPVDEAERARRAQADTLEGAIYRGLPEILRDHARAIAEDYPAPLAPVRRLPARPPRARVRPRASFVTGSEGTLVAITEATVGLIELPRAKMFAVGHFDSVDEAIAATEDALALEAAAIEMIDRDDPRAVALQARVRADGLDDRGRAGGAAVRDLLRRHAGGGRRAARPARRRPGASTATATTRCAPRRPPSRTR